VTGPTVCVDMLAHLPRSTRWRPASRRAESWRQKSTTPHYGASNDVESGTATSRLALGYRSTPGDIFIPVGIEAFL
jgi:hypothetical protein